MLEVLLYFSYGVIEDMAAATYNKCVQNNRGFSAGLTAVFITVFGVFVLQNILFDFSILSGKLWGFAGGNLIGTYMVVRLWKRRTK